MMNEKIFINEIILDSDLDKVAGGTNGEYRELREILPTVMRIFYSDYGDKHPNYMTTDEVSEWLKINLKIDAKIDAGAWYNPFDSAGSENTYSRNGQTLTHGQVVAECKQFLRK